MDTRETETRICPSCGSLAVDPLGRVVTSIRGIRCDYRCSACAEDFVVVRVVHRLMTDDEG